MAVTVSKWKEYSTWHQSRYIWHVCHQKFCRAARIAIYFSLLLTVFNLPILKDLVRVFFCIAVEDWGIILLVYCHFWLYLPTSVFAFLLVFTNTICISACICSPVGNWQAYRQDSWLDSEGKRFPLVAPWCLTTCSQTQESARNSWNIQMFLNHTFRHSWTYLPDKCLHIWTCFYPKIVGLCSTFQKFCRVQRLSVFGGIFEYFTQVLIWYAFRHSSIKQRNVLNIYRVFYMVFQILPPWLLNICQVACTKYLLRYL